MAHVTKSMLVGASVEEVYALARDPDQWANWFVGLSDPETVTGTGEVGTVFEGHYLVAGLRFPLTTEVLEDQVSSEGARWRGTIGGPLAGEHAWTYEPEGDGTQVTVELDYTVPGALLGRFADRLIVERMQARNVEQSLANLKLLCESG